MSFYIDETEVTNIMYMKAGLVRNRISIKNLIIGNFMREHY